MGAPSISCKISTKLTAAFGVLVHIKAGVIMGAPCATSQPYFRGTSPPSLNAADFNDSGGGGGVAGAFPCASALPAPMATRNINATNDRNTVFRIPSFLRFRFLATFQPGH